MWDLGGEGGLLYQSSILTAYPLTAVASDPSYARIVVGASDGVLRFYDLTSLPACRSLQVRCLGPAARELAVLCRSVGAGKCTVAWAVASSMSDGLSRRLSVTPNEVQRAETSLQRGFKQPIASMT